VAGQSPGDLQQSAAQGARGADGCVWETDQLCPSEQVVSKRAEHGPGAVGVELAGGEVHKRLVLEIGDDLLDDGVIAMLGLDQGDVLGAVGEQREVTPVGPQLCLRADQAGASDDQSALAVGGLGDLRFALLGVVGRASRFLCKRCGYSNSYSW
jgi:hypothetical protein